MKDKELIENSRLRERTGGYHKYVDAAEVHNPDPTSSHFVSGKSIQLSLIPFLIDRTGEVRQRLLGGRPACPLAEIRAGIEQVG
jgi:hypothetical protein